MALVLNATKDFKAGKIFGIFLLLAPNSFWTVKLMNIFVSVTMFSFARVYILKLRFFLILQQFVYLNEKAMWQSLQKSSYCALLCHLRWTLKLFYSSYFAVIFSVCLNSAWRSRRERVLCASPFPEQKQYLCLNTMGL